MGLDRVTERVHEAERWARTFLAVDHLCAHRRRKARGAMSYEERNALATLATTGEMMLRRGVLIPSRHLVKHWNRLRRLLVAHVEGHRPDAWMNMIVSHDPSGTTGRIVRALFLLGLVDRSGDDVRLRWRGVVA